MSGTVCHTRRRRRRPDVPSADPLSRSGTFGRLRYRHELPASPVPDVACHARPHLLSGALRPDADPGWPIRWDRFARLDYRRIFLSGRTRTLES